MSGKFSEVAMYQIKPFMVQSQSFTGCGQRFPDDPMIGVRFPDGALQEFWREELGS